MPFLTRLNIKVWQKIYGYNDYEILWQKDKITPKIGKHADVYMVTCSTRTSMKVRLRMCDIQ
jgi:hypothetical protein